MREEDIDRVERQAVLENDRKVLEQRGGTFHQHAQAQANELSGGRFAATGSPIVTGSTAIPKYPAASAPFQSDPVGIEPPLGFSIDEMPNPTGDVSSGVPVDTGPASADAPSLLLGDAQRAGAGPLSHKQTGDE